MSNMTAAEMEATLVIHEALLGAIAWTHPKPGDLLFQFGKIYGDLARNMRKGLTEETEVTKCLQQAFQRVSLRLPRP